MSTFPANDDIPLEVVHTLYGPDTMLPVGLVVWDDYHQAYGYFIPNCIRWSGPFDTAADALEALRAAVTDTPEA